MEWNFDNNLPVYIQIIEQVKRRIIAGEYVAGSKLPSVRDLAVEASVNPNTMQRALSDLEREGLIYSERTSGRFVTEDFELLGKIKEEFAQSIITKFISDLSALGFTAEEILNAVAQKTN